MAGAAEALFPLNEFGAPDFHSTDLVARTQTYLGELPGKERRLLYLLFLFVELFAALVTLRRFSRLPVERRVQLVRTWRASQFFPLRVIGDSVKAVLTMIYMSHADVLRHIGMYAACGHHEMDPLKVEVRPSALKVIA
jgi:hypothetical protein